MVALAGGGIGAATAVAVTGHDRSAAVPPTAERVQSLKPAANAAPGSVEQVAAQLGLHVRTVRNYVRDGRLKAVRIGKQYRIARADLDALTGQPPAASAGASTSIRSGPPIRTPSHCVPTVDRNPSGWNWLRRICP